MKIGDLIELIDENTYVSIYCDETGEIIATYDGRNSIPKCLNPCIVKKIRAEKLYYGIVIEI